MNLSLKEINGQMLVVSQFTLYGDCERPATQFYFCCSTGNGRSFYEEFCKILSQQGVPVEKGVFGAHMEIDLINDRSVTLMLDSKVHLGESIEPIILIVGQLGVNCYIPYCGQTRQCAIVDPGDNADKILGLIEENNLKIKYILLTHGHLITLGL